ncbi:UDP-glucose iridoid glucosyltransferase-like isoform X2 [Tripterygium wilfordii]|uniref:UDP-glucose iridoid glucosyltransferase-like isoform X2 n=1 Tax=Tripterygium wilfordii TaxID=458696 RepID=UPI0018F845B6|nr:UDP-glucose iridoid glucosyltransferase-like isoform X2 [Tripterygium wilfordii]
MAGQEQRRRGVILVPFPYQGHINPMLQLGTILHSRGFSITIIHAKFNSPDPSNNPEFVFHSIPDNLSVNQKSSGDILGIILALNFNCQTPFQECLVQLIEQQDQHGEISCVVYDELMYFSESVASHLRIPTIILRTTTAATFVSRLTLQNLKAEGYLPLQVPDLQHLRFKDLPISILGTPEIFFQLISHVSNVRKSSAVIWNTTECLEKSLLMQLKQHFQVPIFPIGPMHKFAPTSSSSLLEEDTSCITWLDKQTRNSVLYVSLGSLALMDISELTEMAWGLANSKQPFLWVIRPGIVNGSKWIEFLPRGFVESIAERGYIVKWVPQKEVLAHDAVGGFWSHCGWNSTIETISEGVPMICKPSFGDQRVNARYVSQVWKTGLHLENNLESHEVERTIRRLMVDEEGEEMRHRARELKEEVEQCVRNGGSSNNHLEDFVKLISSF